MSRLQPKRRWRSLISSCLLLLAISVGMADTLPVPDSVQAPLWSDSALSLPDSVPHSAGVAERWLIPLGVILVSGIVAVVLFSARSK